MTYTLIDTVRKVFWQLGHFSIIRDILNNPKVSNHQESCPWLRVVRIIEIISFFSPKLLQVHVEQFRQSLRWSCSNSFGIFMTRRMLPRMTFLLWQSDSQIHKKVAWYRVVCSPVLEIFQNMFFDVTTPECRDMAFQIPVMCRRCSLCMRVWRKRTTFRWLATHQLSPKYQLPHRSKRSIMQEDRGFLQEDEGERVLAAPANGTARLADSCNWPYPLH